MNVFSTVALRGRLAALTAAAVLAFAPAAHAADTTITDVIKELGLRESEKPVSEMPGWKKPTKIVVRVDNPERLKWYQEAVKGVTLVPASSAAEAAKLGEGAQAQVGFCTRDIVNNSKAAHWFHVGSAGVDRCLDPLQARGGGIIVSNMQRVYGPSISEHVMMLMLSLTRGLPSYVNSQAQGKWDDESYPLERIREIKGLNLLVVGLGGIGTEVARLGHAFGMRVVATRNSGREGPDFVSYVGLADEAPKLAAEADVVVNATPLTPETRGMFNAAFFAKMKPTAIFINIGRGESVVTDDIVAALNNGTIGGAGLDVTDPEPLPADHPLWKAKNTLITPHVASEPTPTGERYWLVTRENLRRYVAGEKMLSLVNLERGY